MEGKSFSQEDILRASCHVRRTPLNGLFNLPAVLGQGGVPVLFSEEGTGPEGGSSCAVTRSRILPSSLCASVENESGQVAPGARREGGVMMPMGRGSFSGAMTVFGN